MTEYSKPIDKRIMYHQGVTFQIRGEKKKIEIQNVLKTNFVECYK